MTTINTHRLLLFTLSFCYVEFCVKFRWMSTRGRRNEMKPSQGHTLLIVVRLTLV